MDAPQLYAKLQSDNKDNEKLREVSKKIIEETFENEMIELTYRTENPDLNVGEKIVSPEKFLVDGVKVQNVRMGAGAKINVRGSYYDTAVRTEALMTPAGDLSAGAPGNGQNITVNINVIATITPNVLQGEALVMFTEGYS